MKKTEEENTNLKNDTNLNEEKAFDFSELNKKLLKNENIKNEEGIRYIDLITDFDGKKIRVGISEADTIWQHLKTHELENDAYYLGILNVDLNSSPHSKLQLLSLNVPILAFSILNPRSAVTITADEVNKLAIVEGYSSGGMIYKANILAVFEEKPMELLMLLLEKNEITPYLHSKKK